MRELFSKDPDLMKIERFLKKAGMQEQDVEKYVKDIDQVFGGSKKAIVILLDLLDKADILTEMNFLAYFKKVKEKKDLGIVGVVKSLQEVKGLTQTNYHSLLKNPSIDSIHLVSGLHQLKEAKLQTPDNCNALLRNAHNAEDISTGLVQLRNANLLTQENFDILKGKKDEKENEFENPRDTAWAIIDSQAPYKKSGM